MSLDNLKWNKKSQSHLSLQQMMQFHWLLLSHTCMSGVKLALQFFIRKTEYLGAYFNCSTCMQLQIFLVSQFYLWIRNNRKDLSSHTVVASRWHCLLALHFLCFFLWATGVIYSVVHSVRLGTFLWQSQGDWRVESEPTQSGCFICTWMWDDYLQQIGDENCNVSFWCVCFAASELVAAGEFQ